MEVAGELYAFVGATQAGDLGTVQRLWARVAPVWQRNDLYLDVPFAYACNNGHLAVARWLLTLDADTDIHWHGNRALHAACEEGHFGLARWLLTLEPETYVWPSCMDKLKQWSAARDGWMRAVAQAC
jgi:hypothetical protein